MKPTKEFEEAVRARVLELSGQDMGDKFTIRDIFPGTNPEATDADRIEAIAQSLVRLERGELIDRPPRSGRPAQSIADVVAEANRRR
jgi:hypothetical protein